MAGFFIVGIFMLRDPVPSRYEDDPLWVQRLAAILYSLVAIMTLTGTTVGFMAYISVIFKPLVMADDRGIYKRLAFSKTVFISVGRGCGCEV